MFPRQEALYRPLWALQTEEIKFFQDLYHVCGEDVRVALEVEELATVGVVSRLHLQVGYRR